LRARNTPTLTVRVNGYEQRIAALPDTGACLSIISPSWIEEFDLWHKVDTSAPPKLSSATGSVMEAKGTIDLQLTVITKGKAAASTRVTLHRRHRQARPDHRLGGSHSSRRHPSDLSRALGGQCGPSHSAAHLHGVGPFLRSSSVQTSLSA
jgi:hypothetical protein